MVDYVFTIPPYGIALYDCDSRRIYICGAGEGVEATLIHEILHAVLHELFGEVVCLQYDNVCAEVEGQ